MSQARLTFSLEIISMDLANLLLCSRYSTIDEWKHAACSEGFVYICRVYHCYLMGSKVILLSDTLFARLTPEAQ